MCYGIQHAIPPEFGGKWGAECLNTRFPLPTMLCAGYNVNLIFFFTEYSLYILMCCSDNTEILDNVGIIKTNSLTQQHAHVYGFLKL